MGKIHFLNVGCADSTLIESNGSTILIDCYNPIEYRQLLPSNKRIQAVFITHQHYDHFLGLEYLKENNYNIDALYCSPYERRYGDNSVQADEWKSFNDLVAHFQSKGTKVIKPFRQASFVSPFLTLAGINIFMIGPEKTIATKETRELHDASLVITMISNRTCCFAGDASDTSLNWISKNTTNYCNDILHASHHGSINGADLDFIKTANISNTIISTKYGVYPSVPDSVALQRYNTYTKLEVLRTDLKGSIHWDF